MEEPLSSDPYSPLLPDEIAVLKRIVDIVIPPDQFGTGGVQAGVLDFLLTNLAEDGYFPKDLPRYELLISYLSANWLFELDTPGQEALLEQFAGEHQATFDYIVEQMQEGYYTSPAGFDLVGWTVTG